MSHTKRPRYDEDLLVELLRKNISHRRIADRVGVSRSTVARIAAGKCRKDLHARIMDQGRNHYSEPILPGVQALRASLARHIKIGLERDDETARKCREFVMNTFLDTPGGASSPLEPANSHLSNLSGLSDETKQRVLAEFLCHAQ